MIAGTETCKICGNQEAADGTKLCNRCWELDRTLDSLIRKSPMRARRWLAQKLYELEGSL
jgi:hypothetical protein